MATTAMVEVGVEVDAIMVIVSLRVVNKSINGVVVVVDLKTVVVNPVGTEILMASTIGAVVVAEEAFVTTIGMVEEDIGIMIDMVGVEMNHHQNVPRI